MNHPSDHNPRLRKIITSSFNALTTRLVSKSRKATTAAVSLIDPELGELRRLQAETQNLVNETTRIRVNLTEANALILTLCSGLGISPKDIAGKAVVEVDALLKSKVAACGAEMLAAAGCPVRSPISKDTAPRLDAVSQGVSSASTTVRVFCSWQNKFVDV